VIVRPWLESRQAVPHHSGGRRTRGDDLIV